MAESRDVSISDFKQYGFMSWKYTSLFVLFILTCRFTPAQKNIDWEEETSILESELVSRHPDLYFQEDPVRFHRSLDLIAGAAEGKSTFDVAVMLQQAVAGLGDPNTRVNYHYLVEPGMILPLRLYWFEDGLYVLRAGKEYASLAGKRIVGVNSRPLSEVVDSLSSLIPGKNAARTLNLAPGMITWAQLLMHFGFADSTSVDLMVEGEDGQTQSTTIRLPVVPGEMVSLPVDSLPLGFHDQRSFFHSVCFPEEKTCYIQYNQCWSREAEEKFGTGVSALFMPSFRDFRNEVVRDLQSEKIERLVFDLRFNEGGFAGQGTQLIRKIKRTPAGRNSKVYLLVGRKTDGAAILNALDLMDSFEVLTIGETTSGKPNHFDKVERFILPGSGLVINCSGKYIHPVKPGDPEAIVPDIHTELSFMEYRSGIDPAFREVFRHPPPAD
jgi:hypothetical protein